MSRIVAETVTVENQMKLFFHNHKLGELLRQSNIRKDKGVSLDTLFQFLLTMAFTGKNACRRRLILLICRLASVKTSSIGF
jgi:hypothetical protein